MDDFPRDVDLLICPLCSVQDRGLHRLSGPNYILPFRVFQYWAIRVGNRIYEVAEIPPYERETEEPQYEPGIRSEAEWISRRRPAKVEVRKVGLTCFGDDQFIERGVLTAFNEDGRLRKARIITRTLSLVAEFKEDRVNFEATAKWISMLGEESSGMPLGAVTDLDPLFIRVSSRMAKDSEWRILKQLWRMTKKLVTSRVEERAIEFLISQFAGDEESQSQFPREFDLTQDELEALEQELGLRAAANAA